MKAIKTEKLKNKLELYNINFKTEADNCIKLYYPPFEFSINIKKNKVFVDSKIKGWNFVTGLINISFEKTLHYLFIKQIILILLFLVPFLINKNAINFYVLFSFVAIVFFVTIFQCVYYINYRIKHDNFKENIMEWLIE